MISIFKFLSRYYGILLDKGMEYSHKDLKKEFSNLKRCSFEYANKNPDLIASGKIIYVYDCFDNIVPYICPDEIIISNISCVSSDEKKADEDDIMLMDCLSDLPTYVVRNLLSKYKNKPSFYKIIKNELIRRGVYQNKKYKIDREINVLELEESDLSDKCKRRRKIKCH